MINIFYQECEFNRPNPQRPVFFNYEKCFKNLLDTLDNRCKLTVIFDGNAENSYLSKYKDYKFDIQQIKAGDIFKANTAMFEYIKSLNLRENEIIMTQENDYMYIKGWIDCVIDLYNLTGGYHYATLYDHADKYICAQYRDDELGMYKNLVSKIIVTNTNHWRTTPSTCSSFIMSKRIFDEDYDIHTNGQADNSRFGFLTKNRNRIILSPIPGLSTHMIHPWLSPLINWEEINNNTQLL